MIIVSLLQMGDNLNEEHATVLDMVAIENFLLGQC